VVLKVRLALAAVLVLLLAPAAHAATPGFVQGTQNEISNGTQNNVVFQNSNTPGNLIVVYAIWSNTGTASITDTRGNSYAAAAPATRWNNSTWSSQVFYAKNVAGGANTVTGTFGTAINSFGILYVHEYTGMDKINPLDVTAAAIGSARSMDSGSATTTNANDLIFGAGASLWSVTAAGTAFTTRLTGYDNMTEDRVVSTTGSYNATATQNSSAWVMHMAAFKADSGTGDVAPPAVSVSAPADGAVANDLVTLSANATDNVGVAGVQFLVDGVATGTEDTSAPFDRTWDSRTVSNGIHTITAKARDAAGNVSTSAGIKVNVSNTASFQNQTLATGFNLPTTFEFMPDGRMLVGELQGTIKVLPPPYTQADPTPFLQITNIGSAGVQQGIYDIVLDPGFTLNHYFYVFYTLGDPNHDRVSRFTANATLTGTVPGSEFVLYEDPENADAEHHGGALNFANDGTLMFTTGEHFNPSASPLLTSPRGKVHRIYSDGTVPTDNPFYDGNGPNVDSIWARGLRNPYRAYYDAPTGRLYIGDVGGNNASTSKEEIDLGVKGADYGWPDSEGPCASPCTSPLLWYPHAGRDAAVTAGFVYHGNQFPSSYQGAFFYADYTQNWIKGLKLNAGGELTGTFNFEPPNGASDGPYGDIVYLAEGPDGALYYMDLGYSDVGATYGVSKLRRIRYISSNQPPTVSASANPTTGVAPLNVAFSSAGSSDPEGKPLTYSWTFGDGSTSTAANPSHTYTQSGTYTARLTVSDGQLSSISSPITIAVGHAPTATISSPVDGSFFQAGDVIFYRGDGTDPEDGALPASAFTWNIDFLHDGHVHPGTAITGVKEGSFTIPNSGHDFSGNTRYRITLTVTDSNGLTDTKSVTVWPKKVNLNFDTAPSGLTLYLDGIAHTTPFVYDTLIGFNHTIEARNQTSGSTSYQFSSWSDGGGQQHTITVPAAGGSYTATFAPSQLPSSLMGAWSFNEGSGTLAKDSTLNANNGTLSGAGVTWSPSGKYGSALSFDGSSGNVTVPHASSLSLGSSYTLEAWIKPTALTDYQTILIKETTGGCAYWLQTSGSNLSSGFANNTTCKEHPSTSPKIPLNQWSHVAAVFNDAGNTYRLYLNGVQMTSQTETTVPKPNTQDLVFGQSSCSSCGFERWRGLLDDVRIYNRALTPQEIQADMAKGL
jgi:glucose/arabinose dehydrogenase/PKD repeat protein